MAVKDIVPSLLIIAIDTDNESNSVDNDPAEASTDSIGKLDNTYIIPAIKPTATVIAIKDATDPFILPASLVIRANMPITTDKAAVAPASLEPSIIDKTAIAAAITPIATDITIRFPLHSLAPLVALIIPFSTNPRTVTAARPFAKLLTLRRLIITQIPAIIPIAIDIARIVAAILGA